MGKLAFSEGIIITIILRTRSAWVIVAGDAAGREDPGRVPGRDRMQHPGYLDPGRPWASVFSTRPRGTLLSSCCSAGSPADGGVSPGPHSGSRAEPAPPAHRRWLNQASVPRPVRAGAADVEPGSQVLLRTAGSLATASIIRSRWCSHGVMDITHDSLRQSRNSLVA